LKRFKLFSDSELSEILEREALNCESYFSLSLSLSLSPSLPLPRPNAFFLLYYKNLLFETLPEAENWKNIRR